MGFNCHHCGEYHEELPDLGFAFPDYYLEQSEEQQQAAECDQEICAIDGNYFLRGVLEIPIRNSDDSFAYGVWMTLSQENFGRYKEHLADESVHLDSRFVGYLANAIPDFEGSLYLVAAASPRRRDRPRIELEPTDHPLAIAQRSGITPLQLSKTLAPFLHDA